LGFGFAGQLVPHDDLTGFLKFFVAIPAVVEQDGDRAMLFSVVAFLFS